MKAMPTRAEILRAAHVFGLGGDIEGDLNGRDSLQKLVVQAEDPIAFVTLVEHIHYEPLRLLFTLGQSKIEIHNASKNPTVLIEWEKQIQMIPKKLDGSLEQQMKWIRDAEYFRYYDMHDATFAATELDGIPERIFLFVTRPNFNMERIIELLRTYRILTPLPEISDFKEMFSAQ